MAGTLQGEDSRETLACQMKPGSAQSFSVFPAHRTRAVPTLSSAYDFPEHIRRLLGKPRFLPFELLALGDPLAAARMLARSRRFLAESASRGISWQGSGDPSAPDGLSLLDPGAPTSWQDSNGASGRWRLPRWWSLRSSSSQWRPWLRSAPRSSAESSASSASRSRTAPPGRGWACVPGAPASSRPRLVGTTPVRAREFDHRMQVEWRNRPWTRKSRPSTR